MNAATKDVKAARGKSEKNDQKTKNDSAQSNNTGGWGHDEIDAS